MSSDFDSEPECPSSPSCALTRHSKRQGSPDLNLGRDLKRVRVTSVRAERHKIVVGVDFGTTFSGVSFASTAQTLANDLSNISVIQDWPGPAKDSGEVCKAPSRIALQEQNDGFVGDKWGYQVLPDHKACSFFKLALDETRASDFDEPELLSSMGSNGQNTLNAPHPQTPVENCTAYLSLLNEHTMQHLGRRFGPDALAETPIEFWFTVPAIWSHAARARTRQAAKDAGFGTRKVMENLDKIFFIPEPEAAALATFKSLSSGTSGNEQLKEDMAILVCDCGGGTVDITTYRVQQVTPNLVFDELVDGIGGKTGSTSVDSHFHRWMRDVFGTHFTSLPAHKVGPGSTLMKQFEAWKRSFQGENRLEEEYPLELVMKDATTSYYYDADQCIVKLQARDMLGFFKPAVQRILRLLDHQIERVKARAPNYPIGKIILVGGFGDSMHLFNELMKWCQVRGNIKLLCPAQAQAAIVRGAALRGLEGTKPASRRSRAFYGFACCKPFREGIDLEHSSYIRKWCGTKYSSDRVTWQIEKGQEVTDETVMINSLTHTFYTGSTNAQTSVDLLSCFLDTAPDRRWQPGVNRVGRITVGFRSIDLKKLKRKEKDGGVLHQLELEIEVRLDNTETGLVFRTLIDGVEAGTATIAYEDA